MSSISSTSDVLVALLESHRPVAGGDRGVQLLDELVERHVSRRRVPGCARATWLPIALIRCVLPSPEPL